MKYLLDNQIVTIQSEQDGFAFGHYENDVERRFMCPISDIRLYSEAATKQNNVSTAKVQASYSESTGGLQPNYSQITAKDSNETAENNDNLARQRSFIVVKPLLQEVDERWEVLAFFQSPEAYSNTGYTFETMLKAFERGEIKNCPNPVVANMNMLADVNYSRTWYTRSIALLIAYKKQYYPSVFYQKVDSFLNFLIGITDFLLRI